MSPFDMTRTLPPDDTAAAPRTDVADGLTRDPKELPPKCAWRVTVVADVDPSASELRSRHSAAVASTEERHS